MLTATFSTHSAALSPFGNSFSNYTLKYVDASFYQVARGLVLPFTVGTSALFLHARPSLRILLACSLLTFGFFVGVLNGSDAASKDSGRELKLAFALPCAGPLLVLGFFDTGA